MQKTCLNVKQISNTTYWCLQSFMHNNIFLKPQNLHDSVHAARQLCVVLTGNKLFTLFFPLNNLCMGRINKKCARIPNKQSTRLDQFLLSNMSRL